MNHYSNLDPSAFWRHGVADCSPFALENIYKKKWVIRPDWKIGTAGSCFAQHIARYMRQNGYNVLDVEPAPKGLVPDKHNAFGYGMYSARYGNIYTVRQLLDLLQEAFVDEPIDPVIWEKEGRFYDAIRPNVMPGGYESPEAVRADRAHHLERVRKLFLSVDMFVFTLGLTESWVHKETGRVVPVAPGVIAGQDRIDDYAFENFGFGTLIGDFRKVMRLLREVRGRGLYYLLTVSPVPLTATASGKHVLPATVQSKSTLRAVAGELSDTLYGVDYFPSFEIVTNPAARGTFFAANLRSVTPQGVDMVMKNFFAEHPAKTAAPPTSATGTATAQEVQCEEVLLEAFQR